VIDLDHVAIGVDDVHPHLTRLVRELGGTVLYGSHWPGCRYVVTRLGDTTRGMNVELLEPWEPEADPFLVRFLASRGPGANHITFVVDDVKTLLATLAESGLRPARQRLGNPLWREAFFHPRDTGGTVVQVADTTNALSLTFLFDRAHCAAPRGAESVRKLGWEPGGEGWWKWPGERGSSSAVLERVVLSSPDLSHTQHLYSELLGGTVSESNADVLELCWPGRGRLRFERHDDRPAGVLRFECSGMRQRDLVIGSALFRLASSSTESTGPPERRS